MSLVRDEYCGFLKQCCQMLKYGNRCSMCIVGQESYAMLEKNATDYYMCSTICFQEKKTAGTSVKFFTDVIFSETCNFGYSLVFGKGRSLYYKVAHFTLRKFWWLKFYFLILNWTLFPYNLLIYLFCNFFSVENKIINWSKLLKLLKNLNVCKVFF